MVRNNEEALAAAMKTKTNTPGMCQFQTRTWFDAPSAGDQDHDGDSDANDGWALEPKSARHFDRHPPAGRPVYFKGRFGHRAISTGKLNTKGETLIQSTDMLNGKYTPGKTGLATIAQIESQMGHTYVGWSDTIDGVKIPVVATKPPTKPTTPVEPKPPVVKHPDDPKRAPAKWSDFDHLDSSKYMNYYQALMHLESGQGLDVDVQVSKNGTPWAFHWPKVGPNHLHDPQDVIKAGRLIKTLTDAEISRLRGPHGEHPHRVLFLLKTASARGVRIELELKVKVLKATLKKILAVKQVKSLNERGLLQFKTLAEMTGALVRLAEVPENGTTILSFTKYTGKGISKKKARPVVDYIRGNPKWVA